MKNSKVTMTARSAKQTRVSFAPRPLLSYERAVNDNISAVSLREVAKSRQCRVSDHLNALAAELQETRGW